MRWKWLTGFLPKTIFVVKSPLQAHKDLPTPSLLIECDALDPRGQLCPVSRESRPLIALRPTRQSNGGTPGSALILGIAHSSRNYFFSSSASTSFPYSSNCLSAYSSPPIVIFFKPNNSRQSREASLKSRFCRFAVSRSVWANSWEFICRPYRLRTSLAIKDRIR